MSVTRRTFLGATGVLLAGGAAFAAMDGRNVFYAAITEDFEGDNLDAAEAHRLALTRELILVDIRRPDEWTATGSAGGGTRLDLRRDDFTDRLAEIAGDRDAAIALICARGVRSARLGNQLRAAGFTRIIDVPEGMLGSSAGPGWIARGLSLDRTI